MNSILNNFASYLSQLFDIFYKISIIIALFYATKALRIYIDKNSKNSNK
jgi:hypothetical protein